MSDTNGLLTKKQLAILDVLSNYLFDDNLACNEKYMYGILIKRTQIILSKNLMTYVDGQYHQHDNCQYMIIELALNAISNIRNNWHIIHGTSYTILCDDGWNEMIYMLEDKFNEEITKLTFGLINHV